MPYYLAITPDNQIAGRSDAPNSWAASSDLRGQAGDHAVSRLDREANPEAWHAEAARWGAWGLAGRPVLTAREYGWCALQANDERSMRAVLPTLRDEACALPVPPEGSEDAARMEWLRGLIGRIEAALMPQRGVEE
ncbi:MAG TPA: hypothetical protein PLG21_20080 [Anaerolineae bacterium]|nr:hypothetical protein [Anaerolineae bacterium]